MQKLWAANISRFTESFYMSWKSEKRLPLAKSRPDVCGEVFTLFAAYFPRNAGKFNQWNVRLFQNQYWFNFQLKIQFLQEILQLPLLCQETDARRICRCWRPRSNLTPADCYSVKYDVEPWNQCIKKSYYQPVQILEYWMHVHQILSDYQKVLYHFLAAVTKFIFHKTDR